MSLPPTPRFVAVIDIGKTNAKLALVDLETRTETVALRQPNRPRADGPYPHHDVEAIWEFILESLTRLRREHAIDTISVTTHGATAALIDDEGKLALPVLDYEYSVPDIVRAAYQDVRPAFGETGSPSLSAGLNLGAQLFWQQRAFPAGFGRARSILTYPQYWSWRLTGVAASEVTSLGCHTDLWNPHAGDFSSLVDGQGWRRLFPPIRQATTVLGALLPDLARRTGLAANTQVVCGIHDSNASLLPHLVDRAPPFAVVSTGTWVVAMAVGGYSSQLDPARDTLINVDAFGNPVPSARFMGGREFETIMDRTDQDWTENDVDAVLRAGTMLTPSLQQGSGPFPTEAGGWSAKEPTGGQRFVATSYYLALMTATCLDLAGAEGDIVVEGPFAANDPYLSMLGAATDRRVTTNRQGSTGTSIGAALLATDVRRCGVTDTPPLQKSHPDLRRYATEWRERTAGRQ